MWRFLSFFFKLVVVKLVLPCCSLLFKGMILKAAASVRIRIGIWISFKKLQRGIEEVKTLWNVHTYREGKVTGSYGKLPSNPRYQTREEGARVWIRRDKRNSWRGPSLYVENLLKRFDRPFQIILVVLGLMVFSQMVAKVICNEILHFSSRIGSWFDVKSIIVRRMNSPQCVRAMRFSRDSHRGKIPRCSDIQTVPLIRPFQRKNALY